MKYYTSVLLDHNNNEIDRREDLESKKIAIERANYLLSDDYANTIESRHEDLGTRKVEVCDESGECIWDNFHPFSHDELEPKILKEVCSGQRLRFEEMGTSGLVNYVLGGIRTVTTAAMAIRLEKAETLVLEEKGEQASEAFRKAVAAEKQRRLSVQLSQSFSDSIAHTTVANAVFQPGSQRRSRR